MCPINDLRNEIVIKISKSKVTDYTESSRITPSWHNATYRAIDVVAQANEHLTSARRHPGSD